jgi:hypothetical protein
MTLANKTFIVQASLTIVTYKHENIFIVQATDGRNCEDKAEKTCGLYYKHILTIVSDNRK